MNKMSGGDDFILSLKNVASVFIRRFWVIALVVLATFGIAMALSFLQTPQYEASVRMLVGQDQGITDSPTEAVGLQQLTQTMAVAADSRPVAQAVIEELNLDLSTEEFFENLDVQQVASTQFIEISYSSPDAQETQLIANATGEAFSEQIATVSDGAAPITAVLYEQAELPDDPVSPDFFRNGAISLVLGAMLGAGIAFLLEIIDDRWNSPEEAENILDLPVFGVIPSFEATSSEESERVKSILKNPPKKELTASSSAKNGAANTAAKASTDAAASTASADASPSTNGSGTSVVEGKGKDESGVELQENRAALKKLEERYLRLQESLKQSEENNERSKSERAKIEEDLFEKEESRLKAEEESRALRDRLEASETEKNNAEERLSRVQRKLSSILSGDD